jgi:ABC-type multidrug transport system ATPase subunit
MSSALEWSKLSYTLNLKGRPPKVVLDNLSGSLSDGDFLAVLGPSGSGKTSLLNALAGRVRSMSQSELQGQVLLQGKPLLSSSSKRLISYIQQEDCLFARLTVFETLLLSAKFHLPVTSSNELIMGKVEAVIQELGLSACKHTLVGSATVRGVSGGERKRVSVGKELMSSPKYILVDEPTSGLDAFQVDRIG